MMAQGLKGEWLDCSVGGVWGLGRPCEGVKANN